MDPSVSLTDTALPDNAPGVARTDKYDYWGCVPNGQKSSSLSTGNSVNTMTFSGHGQCFGVPVSTWIHVMRKANEVCGERFEPIESMEELPFRLYSTLVQLTERHKASPYSSHDSTGQWYTPPKTSLKDRELMNDAISYVGEEYADELCGVSDRLAARMNELARNQRELVEENKMLLRKTTESVAVQQKKKQYAVLAETASPASVKALTDMVGLKFKPELSRMSKPLLDALEAAVKSLKMKQNSANSLMVTTLNNKIRELERVATYKDKQIEQLEALVVKPKEKTLTRALIKRDKEEYMKKQNESLDEIIAALKRNPLFTSTAIKTKKDIVYCINTLNEKHRSLLERLDDSATFTDKLCQLLEVKQETYVDNNFYAFLINKIKERLSACRTTNTRLSLLPQLIPLEELTVENVRQADAVCCDSYFNSELLNANEADYVAADAVILQPRRISVWPPPTSTPCNQPDSPALRVLASLYAHFCRLFYIHSTATGVYRMEQLRSFVDTSANAFMMIREILGLEKKCSVASVVEEIKRLMKIQFTDSKTPSEYKPESPELLPVEAVEPEEHNEEEVSEIDESFMRLLTKYNISPPKLD